MCSKPLPTVRCRTIGSCGINNRFQLVSRTQGQVAHALLTRPPLIRGRSPVTVRLECVMHAASVNPEPGSNSRNHSILTSAKRIKSISSLIALSLPFLELYSLSELSRYSIALTCFILISYCSIFKDHFVTFSQRLHYYITKKILCQYLFRNFFQVFLRFFRGCRSEGQLLYSITILFSCQSLF